MNYYEDKLNIGVITAPFQNMVGAAILSNFIDILEPISNELFVITGKFPDRPKKSTNIIRIKSDDKRKLIPKIENLKESVWFNGKLVKDLLQL